MTVPRGGLVERTVVGVVWTALSTGTQAIFQLVALVVLARLLSTNQFGLFAAAFAVVGFCSIFSELGVGPAIVQRPTLENRHLRVAFTLSLFLGLGMAALVWAGAPVIALIFKLPELAAIVRGACVVFAFQGFSMVAQASAQRDLRFRWLAGVDAGAFAAGFGVVGPVLAWLGFGVWALVGALTMQHFLRMVLLLVGQPHPKRFLLEWRTIRELLYFGSGFTLARVCNYIAGQGDNVVVGRWLGASALGIYSLAYQLILAPALLVGQVLDRVLFPAMALVQLEPSRLARGYRTGIAVCALLVLPISVVVTIIAPEMILVLLGAEWIKIVVPFRILTLGMLFRTSYKLSDSVSRATGAVYARAWRQAIYACAIVVGSLIGQIWGVEGVALGALSAITLNFLLMAQLSSRLIGIRWREFGAVHLPGLALSAAVGISTWLLVGWLRELQVPPLVMLCEVALFAPVIGILFCWCMPTLFLGAHARALFRSLVTLGAVRLHRNSVGGA